MKQLTDEQTRSVFEKLSKYIGANVKILIDRPDGAYCFRERKNRIYYLSERLSALASNVSPDNLLSAGTCFGKFTKSGKFLLHITALNYLAPYAQHKIWVKSSAELQFLYGNSITKAGLGRITENTQKYDGVTVYSMNVIPLHKIWVKSSAEQQFLYGNSITKAGLGRITENTQKYDGVIVYSMNDIPLGFGVAGKSTTECKHADPMAIVCIHQADVGEYVRNEDNLA